MQNWYSKSGCSSARERWKRRIMWKTAAFLYRYGGISGEKAGIQHYKVYTYHPAGHWRPTRREAGRTEGENQWRSQHAGFFPDSQSTRIQDIRIHAHEVCHDSKRKSCQNGDGFLHLGEASPNNVWHLQGILRKLLDVEVDGSGKDISRGFFTSFDEKAYLNEELMKEVDETLADIIPPEKPRPGRKKR